jgi:hypothetical protein
LERRIRAGALFGGRTGGRIVVGTRDGVIERVVRVVIVVAVTFLVVVLVNWLTDPDPRT